MLGFKRRRWLAVTAFVVPALLLVRFALIEAGVWLVVEDPLEPARAVVGKLTGYGGDGVIVVTSSSPPRRVKILWHALVGKYPEAVVRYTPDDPVQPRRWWSSSADVAAVSHEWLGFLRFWTGFPVKSAY